MRLNILKGAALTAASLAISAPLSAESAAGESPEISGVDTPTMTARDLISTPRLGAPTVTSSGRYAFYTVTDTDPQTYKRSQTHYLLDLTVPGATPSVVNLGISGYEMAFGPDDFLYFVSSDNPDKAAEDRARVWRAALQAGGTFGEPAIVADIPDTDIAGFKLSPNGEGIALWAEISRECAKLACPAAEEAAGSGRLYDGDIGFYRHWDRWITPGAFNRVFAFSLENGRAVADGIPLDGRDVAGGLVANTPTMPFGGGEDIAWAPDGSGVYFVAREAGANEPYSTDLDIYWSDLSGAAPIVLTGANEAMDTGPAPSPDGTTLAYLAMSRPGYESDRLVVQLRDLKTGEIHALTTDTDLSFSELSWSADGKYLLASASRVLDTPAYRINPVSGKVTELNLIAGNEAHISNVTPLAGNRLLFTRDSIGVPAEMFLSNNLGEALPLTDIVTTRMGQMASTVTTRFSFAGADGDTVWGQITRLEDQKGPIPAILYIHGGPQGSFSDSWSSRWNPRVLASQGYAVISVDFHGSTGYGQEFTDAINRDWGGKPLEDLQKGLDAALKIDTQIDGTRTCAMGASYGGFMINWIAGNWSDRFDCLVQHDGLFDMRSFYYSTEETWFPSWDFGGSYAEAGETYERWNPVNHVDKWETPMLVITGEKDFRVPSTQGLQSFKVLQEREIPSQLLVFPDENHWVRKPENSLQWHDTIFSWLDRWLKQGESSDQSEENTAR